MPTLAQVLTSREPGPAPAVWYVGTVKAATTNTVTVTLPDGAEIRALVLNWLPDIGATVLIVNAAPGTVCLGPIVGGTSS